MSKKTEKGPEPLVINGWTIYAHPLFLQELEALAEKVEALKKKDPRNYKQKNATKRLAAIRKLAFTDIPEDPAKAEYRQGSTLGEEYTHWFRAKFFQQYRLFFRFHLTSKLLVLAWVNDEQTKRAYESNTDAYKTFRKMLDRGRPPDSWDSLLKQAKAEDARLRKALGNTNSD
ncbi:type II toxin-antitoxin system YhaV family toxin [Variovorax robiniae]|uniref:Type II toxin-antitoxin system YhaV family toxin n=1 Tax=Variovorax robiniae TaxID=1836199 RepID=A0ABU8XDM4_9BURK